LIAAASCAASVYASADRVAEAKMARKSVFVEHLVKKFLRSL